MNFGAYVHPVFQIAALSLGLLALANGLRVRRARRGGSGAERAGIARLHMRIGRCFAALFTTGYALGLGGMRFALESPLYETAHAYFATLALCLLWTTAWLGRRLRKAPGNSDLRQIHAYCGFLAVFVSLFVAFLGMRLLP